ncbi:MAG TPA: PAS domain-containing protein, partial [Methanomicrobiales archaeon]|nr:PAS domain-containing protein [Methanomicrobiales archaeon]
MEKKQQVIEGRIREFINGLPENPTDQERDASQLVEELAITLEELKMADEELHRQNEELQTTQKTLESERQKYRDLFENAPDGYVVTDPAGTIMEANRKMGEMLQVHPESLAGRSIANFLTGEDDQTFATKLQDLAHGREVTGWEVQ